MTIDRSTEYLTGLVNEFRKLPCETEWAEFKHNKAIPEEIGEYISALANSAALLGKTNAYIIWGIDDKKHSVVGTSFCPSSAKVGNEELESWLLRLLKPKINFRFFEVAFEDKRIVLLEIGAAFKHPVEFKGEKFIRVRSYKKRLKEFPEKERELWRALDQIPFEAGIAAESVTVDEIFKLIDYPAYFDLSGIPLPDGHEQILHYLSEDGLIRKSVTGKWDITNLGAILFAKKLDDFDKLKRKAVRVIQYKGNNKLETIREQEGKKGYAAGFEGLIESIMTLIPSNEIIEKALRTTVPMFPEIAVRELVANALIHQDFFVTGAGTMIEIFDNRIEITNPGTPLVDTDRFLDSPPKSRNEQAASLMRRFGVCEERGSGIDKVVFQVELYQLPAPLFEVPNGFTRVVLFAHKPLADMDKKEKVRACYLHCCLRYVQQDLMTNSSLRKRFAVEEKNIAMISRIIRETLQSGLIRCYDESVGSKARQYIPHWA